MLQQRTTIDQIEFIRIPAGEFLMGSDPAHDRLALARETPQHVVFLDSYLIGRFPITNSQYATFVRTTGRRPPKYWPGAESPAGKESHPVVYITRQDALDYCQWFAERTSAPARLPTEAEWENAARGPTARIYPWGDKWDETNLNSHARGADGTTPVDRFTPRGDSVYGVADMCGNVWEWCSDWFGAEEYQRRRGEEVHNPTGPANGSVHVQRGGSCWEDPISTARCAFRDFYSPYNSRAYTGFRIVCAEQTGTSR